MRKKNTKKDKKNRKKKKKQKKQRRKKKKKKKKKEKKNKKMHLKRTCAEKRFDTPNSFDLGRFSRRHFNTEKKKNKKKCCFAELALPTLFWQPCSANPAWRTLIFRSIMLFFVSFFFVFEGCGLGDMGGAVYVFLCFLKGAGWGIREVLSMFIFVFLCFLFLCFSVFFFVFFCVSAAS